jgi:hypothetical protein
VDRITAYLFHAGGHDDPAPLAENADKSFQGSIVLGMGFTFDDTDRDGTASSLSEMHGIIEKDQRNAERIFPYLGGEEVNNSPTHAHHRYVINFEDLPLCRKEKGHSWFGLTEKTQREQRREGVVAPDYPRPVAADWPDLLRIVEERVKPERAHLRGNPDAERRRKLFWKWGRYTPALFEALQSRSTILAIARVTQNVAFGRVSSALVCAESIVAVIEADDATFSVLQSRPHEIWARFFSSSMKDDLRYSPSDCFETFPFPSQYHGNPALDQAGRTYYDFRAAVMVRNNEGLTKTYNRFHNPKDGSPEIAQLRRLHDAMDRAVLNAYGWFNLTPSCEFFSEFEDEDNEESESGRTRPKKYRYRWPDEIHDEVLARLLELNRTRAEEEAQSAAAAPAANTASKRGWKSSETAPVASPTLFEVQEPIE